MFVNDIVQVLFQNKLRNVRQALVYLSTLMIIQKILIV